MHTNATPSAVGDQAAHTGDQRPRLLVVEPDPICPLNRYGDWLVEAGIAIRVIRPFAGEPLPQRLDDDALLVLGGGMSANDDAEHPWLADIRKLMRQATKRSLPTLGICLGGQLLAQTFGGTVTVGDRGLETGVIRIGWRPEAGTDPLFAGLRTPFLTAAFHGDMIATLPDTAVWCGHSDMYHHQAFRVGAAAWGVQFHPEASLAEYEEWVAAYRGNDHIALRRVQHGLTNFRRCDDVVMASTQPLATRFARLIHINARQRQRSGA